MQGGPYTHGNRSSSSVRDKELFRQAERLPASQDILSSTKPADKIWYC